MMHLVYVFLRKWTKSQKHQTESIHLALYLEPLMNIVCYKTSLFKVVIILLFSII